MKELELKQILTMKTNNKKIKINRTTQDMNLTMTLKTGVMAHKKISS